MHGLHFSSPTIRMIRSCRRTAADKIISIITSYTNHEFKDEEDDRGTLIEEACMTKPAQRVGSYWIIAAVYLISL